ncbi:MAG: MBL fold metallo-hydrolase [Deltaproteobacteria bacterium]|nr:MBL fold metallo-hydrolase [Deltaproteobacteria bacterium]
MSEVIFVGTSDAFGAGGRRQAAVVVRLAGGTVLLDCGMTTGTGMAALGIAREEIDAILISHFHADHFGGIPQFLLASLYEDGRRRPLHIGGPPGVEARVRAASAALGHPLVDAERNHPLLFVELSTQGEVEVGPAQVSAFAVHHQPDACPHGVGVRCGNERVVYTGDTGWFEGLPRFASNSQLFVCECTQLVRGYDFHLSHEELVERKGEFDCGRMILTHLGSDTSARRGRLAFETADDGMLVRL